LPDALFDTVVCNSCFPHFQNKPAALCEIRRLLKNGGWLFICHTSGRIAINNIHHQTAVLAQDLIPEDNQMYAMMQSAGFEDVVIQDSPDSYLASGRKADG
jgi:SAM-dependent methyltransferase